jgi:hypothetical protein
LLLAFALAGGVMTGLPYLLLVLSRRLWLWLLIASW